MRRQLIREFHAILKEQQDKSPGSGLECVACWRSAKDNKLPTITGNAANAASAAKQVTKMVHSPVINETYFIHLAALSDRHLITETISF